MRIMLAAKVELHGKEKPIVAGYRPTLQISGTKMLCNFDSVHPTPLKPSDVGLIKLRVWWDTTNCSFPLVVGSKFQVLEGGQDIGHGVVTELL